MQDNCINNVFLQKRLKRYPAREERLIYAVNDRVAFAKLLFTAHKSRDECGVKRKARPFRGCPYSLRNGMFNLLLCNGLLFLF